jgi:hypothetical protein
MRSGPELVSTSISDRTQKYSSRHSATTGWTIRDHVRKIVRMAPIPLSCIRGADIDAAQRLLPPCDRDPPDTKAVSWFWAAARADLVSKDVCDRKGPRERVVDESHDPPITGISPTCSVCGKPQMFPP